MPRVVLDRAGRLDRTGSEWTRGTSLQRLGDFRTASEPKRAAPADAREPHGPYWETLRAPSSPCADWAYFDHAAVPLPADRRCDPRLGRRPGENGGSTGPGAESRSAARPVARPDRRRSRRDRLRQQHDARDRPGRRGLPLARGRQRRRPPAEEYPSNIYPWMNLASRGVDRPDWSRAATGGSGSRTWPRRSTRTTRVLTISHVEFASGFRNDLDALAELCRARGVALFVDAIQGLGPLDDRRAADADRLPGRRRPQVAARARGGGAPLRPPRLDRAAPAARRRLAQRASARTTRPEIDFTPQARAPSAGRGARSTCPACRRWARAWACSWRSAPTSVSRRILDRAEAVRELAASAGWQVYGSDRPGDRSGIVALDAAGRRPRRGRPRRSASAGSSLACRRGRLRVSPHVYNNDDDLGRLRRGAAPPGTVVDELGPTAPNRRPEPCHRRHDADPSRTAVFTGTFDPITLGPPRRDPPRPAAVRAPGRRHRRQPEQGVAVHDRGAGRAGPAGRRAVPQRLGRVVRGADRPVRPPDRGAGDPPRPADALRHGVRVRHDPDQPAARPRRSRPSS